MFLCGSIKINKPQKHLNTSNFDGVGYKPENEEIRKMKICLLQRNLSSILSKSMQNINFHKWRNAISTSMQNNNK